MAEAHTDGAALELLSSHSSQRMRVGLVADTHGRFDPALPRLFAGCDLIVHAGDIVGQEILHQLAAIAPVKAIKGNVDRGALGTGLETELILRLGELRALLVHELGKPAKPLPQVKRTIERERVQLVVFGHSHQPQIEELDGVLYLNPGSAGPRRFKLPRCAGRMTIDGRRVTVELLDLDDPRQGLVLPLTCVEL